MQLCEAFEPPQPLLEYQQTALPYPIEALGELLGPAVERLDAVRSYQAQHQSQSETWCVAASVATLSPRARPGMTRVVAAVATRPPVPADIALLIEQLREEGALLEHQKNAS